MLIAAGLALASALSAWLLISGKVADRAARGAPTTRGGAAAVHE
jgi:hypothetical protein